MRRSVQDLSVGPPHADEEFVPRSMTGSNPDHAGPSGSGRGRRGRPTEMPPAVLLEKIQRLAKRREGLFRVHRTHRDLYARARRQFGSWAAAVRAAGLDYDVALRRARARSIQNRRRQFSLSRRPGRF